MSNYSASKFSGETNTSWHKALSIVPEGSTVLDVGCSSGNFGRELAVRKECIVDGIEIDHNDAKEARSKLRNVWELNVESDDLTVLTGLYDVIYFGDVIEHLVEPVATLKRLKAHLSGSGRIIFSIPNMAHIGVRLELMAGRFAYSETGLLDKTHLHFYDREEIERVFNEAGYSIQEWDFVKKDYPKLVLDKELNEIGLVACDKFYETAKGVDAAAFQFIGTAVPEDRPKKSSRPDFSPVDHFQRLADILESRVVALEKENLRLQEDNKVMAAKIEGAKEHPFRFAYRLAKAKLREMLGR